jgi:preprotein translocase subunit SecY
MMAGVLTLGTIILMVMAELIDKKGIGKGMSLIIFAGILMVIPDTIYMYGVSEFTSANHQLFIPIVKSIILVIFVVGVILFILYMEGSTRKIPIQYHRGTQADGKMPQAYKSYIPMKINSAGVIPVIFAVSLVMTPTSIAQFFPNSSVALFITKYFSLTNPVGVVFYSLLIIAFTYFYAFVQINPEKMADNLKKSGGYIPGIRPGRDTQNYFSKVLGRLTFSGAIYLTLIAILPIIITDLAGLPQQVRIGGTSLIILISVALDTVAQIESQLTQRSYRGFLKK